MASFLLFLSFFFFFNDTATTEIYTLSLHDALPICTAPWRCNSGYLRRRQRWHRSEEHTSELQSRLHLVCRLLLEKKKQKNYNLTTKEQEKTTNTIEKTKDKR